jgi:hypothetical protein
MGVSTVSEMGSNPSYFYCVLTGWPSGTYTNLDRPVETVSWNEAMTYCLQQAVREVGHWRARPP